MKKIAALLLFSVLLQWQARAQQSRIWTLEDCMDYAVANNITVKSSKLDKATAELNYKQSKNNRLPSVTGNGSLNATNGSSIDAITSDFINQFQLNNSFSVTGSMTLYQGGKLNLEIDKNELLVNQSTLYQEEAENNIRLSVIEAYLQALYYHEGIIVAENAVASSEEELKQAQVKFDQGAIAQIDLADIQTQHAANKYTVVSSKNLYAQQVLTLKQLLELGNETDFHIDNIALDSTANVIPDKDQVYQAAIHNLPTLKIYDAQEAVLGKELQIAKAGYLPTLSLSGGLNTGYTNTMDNAYFTQLRGNFSQTVGLSLSVPIFSKKQNKTNIELAKINIAQNQLDKISADKTLYAKIENAWQNAIGNQAQQESAKVARDNAELAYNLAKKKYEFGGLTTTELAVSRNSYLNAEQTYLQSKYLSALYASLLDFYQGKNNQSINP